MKKYEAPHLYVDDYAADTMISSTGPKNGNPSNQNCYGYDQTFGEIGSNGDVCLGF